jgi:hypothetical protein
MLDNPIYKELQCLARDRIDGLRVGILQSVVTSETLAQENFDKGLYRGLLNLEKSVEEISTIIQQRDKK